MTRLVIRAAAWISLIVAVILVVQGHSRRAMPLVAAGAVLYLVSRRMR